MMIMMMMIINCCYQHLGDLNQKFHYHKHFFQVLGGSEIQRFLGGSEVSFETKHQINITVILISMYFIYFHVLHYPSTVLSHNVQH